MEMFLLAANLLAITGACILAWALFIVRCLIAQLPIRKTSAKWYALAGMILVFILGYFGYVVFFWGEQIAWHDLIVPVIFFLGACFVWLTVKLSLQTVLDVRRMVLLEHENITDPLIGIYNRRYLDRRLDEEVERAQRYALPLSILLLDVDHFKHVNDKYGHQTGDRVLVHLGKLLMESVRKTDEVARYGGEEILIVLPHTPILSAAHMAERIRRHVETHPLLLDQGEEKASTISFTASIGVAALDSATDSSRALVQSADAALYQAKQEGRNRVAIGNAPPEGSTANIENRVSAGGPDA